MERSGLQFFVADYNNDCVRRLWEDGFVRTILAIYSKPFELSRNLYVAAQQKVYEVTTIDFHY